MKFEIHPQFHPAAALHQPRLLAVMLEDWSNRPNKVSSDYLITDEMPPKGTMIGLDTETDGQGGIGCWSIAWRGRDGRLRVKPLQGAVPSFPTTDYIVAEHNAKYDNRELIANKMTPPAPDKNHDSMIMAYCKGFGKQAPKEDAKSRSGSDMVGGLGLKYLSRRHLGMQMKSWQEVKDNPSDIPEYNANDSLGTFLLAELWLPTLPKHYFDIDMPLLPVLMAMEDRGIQIDPTYLTEYASELDNRLSTFDELVQHLAFHTQDLQSYVYGTLEVEPWAFTDTGAPSTEAEVIEKIDDPVLKQVLAYKELYKDKGTYIDHYVKGRDEQNRIHCEFKQVSTSTGRLSCARPNLQNVDKEGNMRKLFVPPPGKKIVRLDYNQLEWRVLGAITQDETIIAALNSGKKIHQVTADEMGAPYDIAKRGNFGIIYGAGAWKLAQTLNCTINEAREFMRRYFEKFPAVKKYQDMMKEIALKDKRVTNWFGRSRRIDAMYVDNWRIQQEGIKEAVNMPIQGAGGEIVKIAMIDLHQKYSAPLISQIHDELLLEVEDKQAVEYANWLKEYIPTLVGINGMRFTVDVGVGSSWYDAGLKENAV